MPLLVPAYPAYDLGVQATVQQALAHAGMPVPEVVALESDARWLDSPFLVMAFVAGRAGGEAPAIEPWLAAAPPGTQRAVQDGFVAALARVHRVDWRAAGLDARLRAGLSTEVGYWIAYADWAADGSPAHVLADALAWCARTVPECGEPPSLLWGDARLGNVLYDDAGRAVALLDWELASIGPAEMDLAWYLVLDELVTGIVGRTPPGFAARADVVRSYERALGRPVRDLAWHEIFALARSIAINDRQARLASAAGTRYPGIAGDANPMLAHLSERIGSFTGAG
jgi:aminoglycoside phosphotransferase (APT) family kinase protein